MHALALRILIVLSLVAGSALSTAAQQAGKKQYELRGKVEKVDGKAKKLTVNHEKVDGWMAAMTMNYKVDKDEVLKSVKAGDQIVATVYEGDFDTLHNVQKAPPPQKN